MAHNNLHLAKITKAVQPQPIIARCCAGLTTKQRGIDECEARSVTSVNNPTILCPECGSKMHKMGKTWSGRKQVQRYRCPKCGRTYAPVGKLKKEEI